MEQEVEVKIGTLTGTSNEELPNTETPTASHEDVREKGEEARGRVRSNNPSVSIENDVALEFTEELLIKQEVESCDSLPLKAMSFNSGVGGAVGGEYIHVCSEDESIDGDHTDGDQPGATGGGDTASGGDRIEPTDSVRGSVWAGTIRIIDTIIKCTLVTCRYMYMYMYAMDYSQTIFMMNE